MLLLRDRSDGDDRIRLGLTVSKKVGNAVVRNRMKRRFRELARLVLPESGLKGVDLVLIGRIGGNAIPFATLEADLRQALRRASRAHEGRTREKIR